MRDPYAVLGVKRDADANEIKTAWRSIAKKIHPDQNRSDPNAARRFAEAGEAYEVLRDPQKRSRYDMLSQSGKQGATIQQQREAAREAEARRKAAEENARKVMEELAKAEAEKARKAAAEAAARKSAEKPAADARQEQPRAAAGDQASKPSEEAAAAETPEAVIDRIFGAQPQFTVSGEQAPAAAAAPPPAGDSTSAASTAQASTEPAETIVENEYQGGSPSGSAGRPLTAAALAAISALIRKLTGGAPPEKAPDQFAEARITIEDLLKENWTTVALPEGRELRFRLDAGVTDGQTLRLKGQGFKVPGMTRGDAVVTLKVEPSPLFRVSGHDIHTALPVSLENAVLGCSVEVQSPAGPVTIEVPSWSGSDQIIRIAGLGLPNGKGGRGDLVAEVRIMLWEKPDAKVTDLMRSMREGLYL